MKLGQAFRSDRTEKYQQNQLQGSTEAEGDSKPEMETKSERTLDFSLSVHITLAHIISCAGQWNCPSQDMHASEM